MSDLRTRIAAVVAAHLFDDEDAEVVADAVIQEIGLSDGTDDLGNQPLLDWFASMEED